MKCSLGISNFLEEISSLFHSVVFLYFFTLIALKSCKSLHLPDFFIMTKIGVFQGLLEGSGQFSSVQLLSRVRLFATP